MARLKGSDASIDISATQRFFQERGNKIGSVGALGAVLYQDQNPELAQQRHAAELARVKALLAPESHGRVLDIGCGTGRWGVALADTLSGYLGLDFCEDFLEAGRKSVAALEKPGRFNWKQWDVSSGTLPPECAGAFDLQIVAGVFIYLNDDHVRGLMQAMAQAAAPLAKIYIREPLGVTERLTLDKEFSQDLNTQYSAIYRSIEEFEALLDAIFTPQGFALRERADLYPEAMNNRADTRQRFYLLTRGDT
jgi:SAM-dependent methyltransferase